LKYIQELSKEKRRRKEGATFALKGDFEPKSPTINRKKGDGRRGRKENGRHHL